MCHFSTHNYQEITLYLEYYLLNDNFSLLCQWSQIKRENLFHYSENNEHVMDWYFKGFPNSSHKIVNHVMNLGILLRTIGIFKWKSLAGSQIVVSHVCLESKFLHRRQKQRANGEQMEQKSDEVSHLLFTATIFVNGNKIILLFRQILVKSIIFPFFFNPTLLWRHWHTALTYRSDTCTSEVDGSLGRSWYSYKKMYNCSTLESYSHMIYLPNLIQNTSVVLIDNFST